MNSLVKKDSYICLQGWMITELELKGTELVVYAIIYGFSQDGSSSFAGTLSYLMQWCNASKNTVLKALRELMNKGLIIKREDMIGGIRVCKYSATRIGSIVDNANNFSNDVDKPLFDESKAGSKTERGVQRLNQGGSKTEPTGANIEHNNIINNIDNNIVNNTTESGAQSTPEAAERRKKSDPLEAEFEKLWELYPQQRRQGKSKAREAYLRARRGGVSMDTVHQKLEAYKRQCAAEQTPTKFIKQGGTWFKSHGWEDTYNDKASPPQLSSAAREKNRALCYEQKRYSKEELKQCGLTFGDEIYDD